MEDKVTDNSPNIIFIGFADNKVPDVKVVSGKDFIPFGEKNDFPNHLLHLYNKSSNHNAIINGKVTYIFGKGFRNNPIVNRDKETLNKVFKKFGTDIELFGGGRLQCIWKMGGGLEISHLPFQNLRKCKSESGYWYRKDWTKSDTRDDKPLFIKNFDPENPVGLQVFAYDEYRPGCEYYPLPGYFGALNDIETDVEISIYNLSVMKNGQFSGKLVSFFNGIPTLEQKKKLEKQWEEKFNGSGNAGKTMLAFNNGSDKEPIVSDLSATDLDKLFEQLNKTVQGEIFSGHQVTSPMLFGIRTEGQLGGRSEIMEAYEIFKNTYINDKQMAIEEIHAMLAPYLKLQKDELIPVQPLTENLNPVDFKEMLPAEWVMEKLGIDINKYPVTPKQGTPTEQPQVNENVKNLTGRQNQQLLRVIRQVGKGKMTREQATTLLKSSLALSDDEINSLLGSEKFDADISEEEFAAMQFEEVGESKNDYTVLKSFKFNGEFEKMDFADLSQVDSDIVNMIGKDKRISAANIAAAIKKSPEYVSKRIEELTKSGVLVTTSQNIGLDTIIERAINPEVIDARPKPESVNVFVKYSYELRPGVKGGEIIETTRPFCRKLLALDRLYTRAEIETISQRLGYSVFDRSGGWWGDKPKCRHEWRRNIVIKKK